jgi:hypothetical protein
MIKFKSIFFLFLSICYLNISNNLYCMDREEDKHGNISSIIVKLDDDISQDRENSSSRIDIEEEGTMIAQISCGKRLCGYMVRCGTIACTTFLGGSIGLAIVSGELNPEVAITLLKAGSPILIGSLIGYALGWGCGNTIKAKITGRC